MTLPLKGIRVLDWTAFQQGPIAACNLADLGADVIKIEDPRGEPGRGLFKIYGVKVPLNFYYQNQNRGKRGIVLNLKLQKGKELLYRLVEKSDIFVTNYRESVAKRLKADYETLRKYNPQLIYAYSSGLGTEGPEADLSCSDFIGQARGGLWSISRASDMSWATIGAGMADEMGGFVTAYGIMVALFVRERTGIGQRIDASLLGGQIELGRLSLQQHLMGLPTSPSAVGTLSSPLYNIYECGDGKWICFGVLQADRYWPQFCQVLGIQELEKDPRFENSDVRGQNLDELMHQIKDIFKTRTRDQWIKAFREGGIDQVGPIQDFDDVVKDPQVLLNHYIVDVDDPNYGKVKMPGIPIKLSETPGKIRGTAPELGQHTEEVLQEVLGLSWEELTKLHDEGVY